MHVARPLRYTCLFGVYYIVVAYIRYLHSLPTPYTYRSRKPHASVPPPSLDIHACVHIRDITDSVAPFVAFRQDGCGKPSAETRALTSPPACHLAVRSPISPPPRHHLATSRCISPPSRHASLAASSHGELTARREVRGSRP